MSKKSTQLNTLLLQLNESISYNILQQNSIISNGLLNIYAFSAIIEQGPDQREKKYFIAAEDKKGLHCIGFTFTSDEIIEMLKHFSRLLELSPNLPLVEYSFPNIFPLKTIILQPL
jgi:hypothetical protein